jgi:hypothetical protein
LTNSPANHTPAMHQASAALVRAGVNFQQPSPHQIKVGQFSFYPTKGTIFRDGEMQARSERGLPAFLRILRDTGHADADDKPVKPVDDPDAFIVKRLDEDDDFATE